MPVRVWSPAPNILLIANLVGWGEWFSNPNIVHTLNVGVRKTAHRQPTLHFVICIVGVRDETAHHQPTFHTMRWHPHTPAV